MTNIDLDAGHRAARGFTHIVRDWWPVAACVAGALLLQQVLLSSRYAVGGHAPEHLGGASAPFMAAAVLSILFWATPRARRQADVLVAAGVVRNDAVGDDGQPARGRRPHRSGVLPHAGGLRSRRGRSLPRQLLGPIREVVNDVR